MFVYDFVETESQGQASDEVDESVRVEPEERVKVHEVADVLNFSALTRRLEMGEHETGERRPDELRKLIDFFLEQGSPVSAADGEARPAQESPYWQVAENDYQKSGLERAMQAPAGTHYITREARAIGCRGMVVGEIDLVAAFFQLLLAEVKILCNDDAEFNKRFATIVRYVQHSGAWREKVGGYYVISENDAKKIFVRLPCGSAVLPDQEWEPRQDRATDDLPCVLQLRHELRCAQTLLTEKSHVYQRILELPRVQASDQKDMSALAIFLMDVETRNMTVVKNVIGAAGGMVLSIVFV